jgi:putative aminopeptidase FrvX
MSTDLDFELMKKLSHTPGVSGFEDKVALILRDELARYVDSVRIDKMGNVIGTKHGKKKDAPKVMVLAHLDEVGLMVKYVEDNGFVRFEKVGDLIDYLFPGKNVLIHGERGPVHGVVGVVPAHLVGGGTWGGAERLTSPAAKDQFIDVGARTRSEVEEMGIVVGSPVTWDTELRRIGNGYLTGKAMDDRALLYALIQTMRNLSKEAHDVTIYAVGTVEEEPGLRGATTTAYDLAPDAAIGLDITICGDVVGMDFKMAPLRLDGGPAIKVMDTDVPLTGLITHSRIRRLLVRCAKAREMPYQLEVFSSGLTTDATAVAVSRSGVPTGVLSLPSRYAHTAVELISIRDLNDLIQLLTDALLGIRSLADVNKGSE